MLLATGAAAGGFVPTDIAGCKLWLDASQIVGLSDGDPVGAWSDLSGNGTNGTASGSARPLYKTGILNGLPVVRFDGTDDEMVCSLTGSAAMTVFIVTKKRSVPGSGAGGFGQNCFSCDAGGAFYTNQGNSVLGYSFYNGGGANGIGGTAFGWSVAVLRFVSTSLVEFYFEGSAGGTMNPGTSFSAGTLFNMAGGTNFWGDHDFAEVIAYDSALSSTDRETVEDYLGAKWGIAIA